MDSHGYDPVFRTWDFGFAEIFFTYNNDNDNCTSTATAFKARSESEGAIHDSSLKITSATVGVLVEAHVELLW